MRTCIFLIILISFFFRLSINAQEVIKEISFDGEIQAITETDNYIAILIQRESYPYYTAYLYDKEGNKIHEYTLNESSLLKAEPIEPLNYFIVIKSGWERLPGLNGSSDIIKLFDINTGNLTWETTSNASFYEISPDKKKILTRAKPEDDRNGFLEIIDLENKNKIIPKPEFWGYHASWINNEKIVIIQSVYEKKDRVLDQKDILSDSLDIAKNNSRKLAFQFKRGIISKDKYNILKDKSDSLINDINNRLKKYNKNQRSLSSIKLKNHKIKFTIYNINTNSIEEEKYINDKRGGEYFIGGDEEIFGKINVDKEGNFYIWSAYKEGDSRTQNGILKIDNKLNFQWFSHLNESTKIRKVIDGDVFHFEKKNDDGSISELDNKTGILKLSDISEDTQYNQWKNVLINYKNVSIETNNTIKFIGE